MRAPMPILHLRALSQVFSLSAAQHASRSNNNNVVPMEQAQYECYLIQSCTLVRFELFVDSCTRGIRRELKDSKEPTPHAPHAPCPSALPHSCERR